MILRAALILALAGLGAQAQDDPAALVVRLSADRPEDRDRAATALKSLGDRAVPALEKGVGSADAEVRLRSRQLLHEVSAVSALVEDLRSDEIPGNARIARNALLRRFDESVKKALLQAVRSDDPQQALEAAFVLVNKGESAAAYQAEPRLLAQSIGMFVRGESEGFHWVAAQVLLGLGRAAGPQAESEAYRKALRGVAPAGLYGGVLQLGEVCRQKKVLFPGPLLRHYFRNFRDDDQWDNATRAGRVVRELQDLAVPELKAMLTDADAQARRTALGLLLDLKVKDLSPAALPALGELLGRDRRALPRLLAFGPAAIPTLEDRLESSDPVTALRAANGLALLDRTNWWEKAARVAIVNLEADTFIDNAREAAGLLFRLGTDALPLLREALRSDDEQVVVCSVAVLAALGEPAGLEARTLDQVFRFASQQYTHDEYGCLSDALAASAGLRDRICGRLEGSGEDGRKLAARLQEQASTKDSKPWLPVECDEFSRLIAGRNR